MIEDEKKIPEKKVPEKKIPELKNKTDKHSEFHRLNLREDFSRFMRSLRILAHDTLHIKDGVDIEGATKDIEKGIVFKGPSVWILVASIFIASIGLNSNSAAVVIGAMLISPLMGPILGVGLAVGTYDWALLKRAMKFLGIAVGISILTSTFYFWLTPIKDAHSELLARTSPTLLDVLIAIFGGIAGIVAGSQKEKTNAIPGVAIATALMPPLCTAGYGLATWQLDFFFGAFYLFFINSVFISLSTYLIIRYLKFPLRSFVRKVREKKIKLYMGIFILLVILPSAKIFWDVIQESRFFARTDVFIADNFKGISLNKTVTYNDTVSYIDIYLVGEEISDTKIQDINDKLSEYGLMGKKDFGIRVTDSTAIRIHQATEANLDSIDAKFSSMRANLQSKLRVGIIEDLYKKNEDVINSKNARIEFLENSLLAIQKDTIPLDNLKKEMLVQYPKIERFAYSKAIETDTAGGFDTIPTFLVAWNKKMRRRSKNEQTKVLARWLKVRLKMDTVRVVLY